MNAFVICIQPDDPETYWLIPNPTQEELALLWDISHIDFNKDCLTDKEEQMVALFQAALGNDFYEHITGYCKWKDTQVKVPLINTNIQYVFTIIFGEY